MGIKWCSAILIQYNRTDNILDKVRHKFDQMVHALIGAHWHSYSHKNRNVSQGSQESLIGVNSIVGDTDYSKSLHLSGRAGFVKATVHVDENILRLSKY